MSWLGQHIWGFISRFRNKIYIETIETGTSDKVLVRETDGLVKEKDCKCATGGEVKEVKGTAPVSVNSEDPEKPVVSIAESRDGSSGLMSGSDKTKLDGIAAGADVSPTWLPAEDPSYITPTTLSTLAPVTALTTTGTSGAATLGKTGILNIPQYTGTTTGVSGTITVVSDVIKGVNSYLEITITNGLITQTRAAEGGGGDDNFHSPAGEK